jgi:hemoglobin-like flavoprotein
MSIQLSERTRALLAHSLPLMQQRKDALLDNLGKYLRDASDDPHDSELVAMMLTELIITQSKHLLESGTLGHIEDVRQEHRILGLEGRHYSRFGDALAPVIRDVLGGSAPREVAGAWGDVFWAVIGAVQERGAMADA